MSSMSVHTGTQPFAPLVDGLVDDLLLHGPNCSQASLQFVHIVYQLLADPFLHSILVPRPCNQPDLDVGCLETRGSDQCSAAFGARENSPFHERMGVRIVLLENKGVSSNAPDVWKQNLRQ